MLLILLKHNYLKHKKTLFLKGLLGYGTNCKLFSFFLKTETVPVEIDI